MHCASILTVSPPFHLPSFFPPLFGAGLWLYSRFRQIWEAFESFRIIHRKYFAMYTPSSILEIGEAGYVSDFEDGYETISFVLVYSFMRFLVRATYDMYGTIDRSYAIVRTRDHRGNRGQCVTQCTYETYW